MKKNSIIVEILDSLFIMLLCFATLLTAMLLKHDGTGALCYHVNFVTFAVTVSGLAICLTFILKHSEKGLKNIVQRFY